MKRGTFAAMGTEVTVVADGQFSLEATQHWFESVEQVCSRFRADSELSVVNAREGSIVQVSASLGAILEEAQTARVRTGGLVDAAVGSAVTAWGYDRTFRQVRDKSTAPALMDTPSWTISGDVLHRAPGVKLDLGGLAKGWACDVAIDLGIADIVSAGGDVRSRHVDARVPVADPWGVIVAEIPIGIGALATSSVTRRRWRVGSRDAHHLIDPRTGAPAISPILSATVTARTAVEAEAGAKAVLLMGEDGLAWADRCPWIDDAIVVWHDGSIYATSDLKVSA